MSSQIIKVEGINVVTFNVQSYFDEFNHTDNVVTDAVYGSTVSFDASLASTADFTFKYWVINDVVEFHSAVDDEFYILDNMSVKALFSPSDAHLAVFLDSNGKYLDLNYVVDGGTAVADGDFVEPTKPGYSVTTNKWDKSLTNITEDTVFILQYEKTTSDTFALSVVNGTGSGTYDFNTEVIAIANTAPAEQVFSHWEDSNSNIVSYTSTYTFTVLADKTITAVYAGIAPTVILLVATQEVSLRVGYYSYLSQVSVPVGYTIIEYGVVTSETLRKPSLAYDNCDQIYRATLMNQNTKEYVISIPINHFYARSYLIIKDGSEVITKIYGPLVSYIPEGSSVIIFDSNDGSAVSPILQVEGSAVSEPASPTKDGYDFAGWYSDTELLVPYTFSTMPVDNEMLYAKWTSYLAYTLKVDETYEVDGRLGDTTNIVIPSTYEGVAVTSIRSYAFDSDFDLTGVIISEGISELKEGAFWNNTNLNYVILPSTLTSIGSETFFNCVSLSSVIIPLSVSTMSSYVFVNCETTTIYIEASSIPVGWEIPWNTQGGIEVWGFYLSNNTSTITFESNGGLAVDTIEQLEFTPVTKPSNPTRGGYDFGGWYSDAEFTTPYIFSIMPIDDVTVYAKWTSYLTYLLKDDLTYEVTGRTGETTNIVIPSTYLDVAVTSIGANAFLEDAALTGVVISEGILEIKEHAFENDNSITSFILPNTLITIGAYAFAYSTNISSIIIPFSVMSVDMFIFEGCLSTTINIRVPGIPVGWSPLWNVYGGIEVWGYTE